MVQAGNADIEFYPQQIWTVFDIPHNFEAGKSSASFTAD
jgi:hypothetical protein